MSINLIISFHLSSVLSPSINMPLSLCSMYIYFTLLCAFALPATSKRLFTDFKHILLFVCPCPPETNKCAWIYLPTLSAIPPCALKQMQETPRHAAVQICLNGVTGTRCKWWIHTSPGAGSSDRQHGSGEHVSGVAAGILQLFLFSSIDIWIYIYKYKSIYTVHYTYKH